jgi:hypothetical protein
MVDTIDHPVMDSGSINETFQQQKKVILNHYHHGNTVTAPDVTRPSRLGDNSGGLACLWDHVNGWPAYDTTSHRKLRAGARQEAVNFTSTLTAFVDTPRRQC